MGSRIVTVVPAPQLLLILMVPREPCQSLILDAILRLMYQSQVTRATVRVAPTLPRKGLQSAYRVGATLTVALVI